MSLQIKRPNFGNGANLTQSVFGRSENWESQFFVKYFVKRKVKIFRRFVKEEITFFRRTFCKRKLLSHPLRIFSLSLNVEFTVHTHFQLLDSVKNSTLSSHQFLKFSGHLKQNSHSLVRCYVQNHQEKCMRAKVLTQN